MTRAPSSGTLPRMTSSDLLRAALHDTDTGDFDAFRARFTPDSVMTMPLATATGPDAIAETIKAYRVAFPDFRHEVTLAVTDGPAAALEGEWIGTHSGPLPTPDGELPPTGAEVRLPFATVGRTDGAHVTSLRIYFDSLSFMAQLGLAPEPAGVPS
jgi:predicted ester cyclase